jgi:hypothetical protein
MRHKNVSVTLKIYTQVKSEEIEASLPTRLSDSPEKITQPNRALRLVK